MSPRRTRPSGAKGLEGSEQARRNAALMLESLSGASGPLEASRAMGVALVRYYQLEARALRAFVGALEPLPRGRHESEARTLHKQSEERRRLERDLHRYQALYRAAQKTLGIAPKPSPASEEKSGRKRRRTRKVTRGERLAETLRALAPAVESETVQAVEGSE